MFDLSPEKLIVLVIIGILVFGPEKLPKMMGELARTLRRFRAYSQAAQEDLRQALPEELRDVNPADLHPKRFVAKHLLGDGESSDDYGAKELAELRKFSADLQQDLRKDLSYDTYDQSGTTGAAKPSALPDLLKKQDRLPPGERPPIDTEAT